MKQNGDDTLQKIAAMTSGKYYTSEIATELEKIFAGLSHIQVRSVEAQEISVVFCALGALLVRAAILFAQMWRPFL